MATNLLEVIVDRDLELPMMRAALLAVLDYFENDGKKADAVKALKDYRQVLDNAAKEADKP